MINNAARTIGISTLLATMIVAAPAAATTTVFTDRNDFKAMLTSSFTDTYDQDEYWAQLYNTDKGMSAVVGETTYRSTGWPQANLIAGIGSDGYYCAGCNGSFTLGFADTRYSDEYSGAVFGVGVDIVYHEDPTYTAFVTYGDGTTENLALPSAGGFFGVTSTTGIRSIAFGGENGGARIDGSFGIDDLTIGTNLGYVAIVPEPATWAMLILGFATLGTALRRRPRPQLHTASSS